MLHTTVIPPQNLEVHIGKLRFVDKNGNKIIDKGDQITSIDGSAVLSVASPEVRAFMKKYGANKLGHKGWKLLSPLVNYFVNMGHARSASLYGDSKGVDRSLNVAASYCRFNNIRV